MSAIVFAAMLQESLPHPDNKRKRLRATEYAKVIVLHPKSIPTPSLQPYRYLFQPPSTGPKSSASAFLLGESVTVFKLEIASLSILYVSTVTEYVPYLLMFTFWASTWAGNVPQHLELMGRNL